MTTKVKNKKDNKEIEKKDIKQNDEINEQLKKKDYILTVHQRGDEMMSLGELENQIRMRRFYVVCSLEEIPEYIKYMEQPFWECPKDLSKKEIKNYPFEKKKWGRYRNVVIEPLSEELEKDYLDGSKKGFFESHRRFHQRKTEREKL